MNPPPQTSHAFTLTEPGTDTPLAQPVHDDGIFDLLRPERRHLFDTFAAQYTAVRAAEERKLTPEEVRALPTLRNDHPLASMWMQRAASYARLTDQLPTVAGTAVDIGAGSGWLAADLTRRGWRSAATDVTVDGGDGLASAKHHPEEILLVRAEMEALPFASNSVDLAVFNASLHYGGVITNALDEAIRIVRTGGVVAVLDSPIFTDATAGAAMVEEFASHALNNLGVEAATHLGPGYVLEADIAAYNFTRITGSSGLRNQVRRWRGARRAGRETASRPLLLLTIGDRP